MNFLKFLGIGVLIILAFTLIGPIIGFGIGAFIAYFSYTSLKKTNSTFQKILWGIVGLIGFTIALNTAPALIGLAAIAYLIHTFANHKRKKRTQYTSSFQNFESEWTEILNKHK